jgi:probable H4MPT-linked C1 transfer pathway protein
MLPVLGLDIGGAHLKAATSDGAAAERPFPLWKHPQRLAEELRSLVAELPPTGLVAVTMTGELADGFASKSEGVRAIVAAATEAVDPRLAFFWQTGGEFLTSDEAAELPRLVAAANWHALATFCGRVVPQGAAVLLDIGSTTTDLVPLRDGRVVAEGLTDLERLRSGELVYTGASRTPVCALGPSLSVADMELPVAAELFATMRDVYLLLGNLREAPDDCNTADHRPATKEFARARLARMLCADPDEIDSLSLDGSTITAETHAGDTEALTVFAAALAARQRALIRAALERVLSRIGELPHLLVAGSGSFLAEQVIAEMPQLRDAGLTSLARLFAENVSNAACAFAVARLAAERLASSVRL